MKVIILLGFLVLVALASARPDDKYTTKYDNVDLNEILKNKRLLKGYVFCLLDKGPCSPDGAELKTAALDLRKAFDSVDPNIPKMSCFKILSYLHDRQQVVEITGDILHTFQVSIGVPQGALLDPSLLMVYETL